MSLLIRFFCNRDQNTQSEGPTRSKPPCTFISESELKKKMIEVFKKQEEVFGWASKKNKPDNPRKPS